MKSYHEKKGAFTIFMTVIFSTIILFLGFIIKLSINVGISSSVDTLGNLFLNNVLSEYDVELKNRYGIIAVNVNDATLDEKVEYYSSKAFTGKKYIKYQGTKSDFSGYELIDGNVFLNEVSKIMLSNRKPIIDNYFMDNNETESNHFVRAKWIINSLPSKIDSKEIDRSILSEVSIYKYLFQYFKDYMNDRDLGRTFFDNEIEYVITGTLDDNKARKEVFNKLLFLRNADNYAYLLKCEEKRKMAEVFAVLIAPEMVPEATAVILEAWALLESKNDIQLLYENEKVPLFKDDESWAITFKNAKSFIFKNKKEDMESLKDFDYDEDYESSSIHPLVIKGNDYDDYLKLLLAKVPYDKKVYRMMDLIQLNMKYSYSSTFLLTDYKVGMNCKMKVNNKMYSFVSSY